MSSKRRLWTGDWERESARRAEELAAARRQFRPGSPEPELEPAPQLEPSRPLSPPAYPPPSRSPVRRRQSRPVAERLATIRRRLPARVVVPVITALLLVAAVVVALTAVLGSGSSSDSASSASVREADAWLGFQLAAGPGDVAVIETLNQNGAAAFAGLAPGDVISQINGRSIDSLGAAANAIHSMNSGQQAVITVERGSAVYQTSFPMPARPGGP